MTYLRSGDPIADMRLSVVAQWYVATGNIPWENRTPGSFDSYFYGGWSRAREATGQTINQWSNVGLLTTHIRWEWDTIFDASPSVKLGPSMIKWMNIWSLLVNSAHFVFCGRSILVHDSVLPHNFFRNKGDGLGTIILLLLWRPHCYAPTKVHF